VARKDLDAQVEQKAKDLIAKLGGNNQQSTEAASPRPRVETPKIPPPQKTGVSGPLVKKNPNKPDALYDRAIDMEPEPFQIFPFVTEATGTSCVG